MSTEMVIVVIGGFLTLIAILGNKKRSSGESLISTKLGIPLGIIGVLMMIFGSYSSGLVNYNTQIEQVAIGNKLQVDYPVNKVQVISPLDGDSVKCRVLTMGVYPESHDKDIWVLLKPSDNKYYPQSDHTNTSYKRDGEWQVITRYGGDKGESYDIVVYETDATASQFFTSTIENWKEALSYPGLELEELPEGANEIDRIVVSLKDNCRGVF
jgi:hypothetical protein